MISLLLIVLARFHSGVRFGTCVLCLFWLV